MINKACRRFFWLGSLMVCIGALLLVFMPKTVWAATEQAPSAVQPTAAASSSATAATVHLFRAAYKELQATCASANSDPRLVAAGIIPVEVQEYREALLAKYDESAGFDPASLTDDALDAIFGELLSANRPVDGKFDNKMNSKIYDSWIIRALDKAAQEGDKSLAINISAPDVLNKSLLEYASQKKVNLDILIYLGSPYSYSWTFDTRDIPADYSFKSIDLKVRAQKALGNLAIAKLLQVPKNDYICALSCAGKLPPHTTLSLLSVRPHWGSPPPPDWVYVPYFHDGMYSVFYFSQQSRVLIDQHQRTSTDKNNDLTAFIVSRGGTYILEEAVRHSVEPTNTVTTPGVVLPPSGDSPLQIVLPLTLVAGAALVASLIWQLRRLRLSQM